MTDTSTGRWFNSLDLNAGAAGTEAQNFVCVYYYKKYIECTWERSAKTPAGSQQRLWYWWVTKIVDRWVNRHVTRWIIRLIPNCEIALLQHSKNISTVETNDTVVKSDNAVITSPTKHVYVVFQLVHSHTQGDVSNSSRWREGLLTIAVWEKVTENGM